MRGRVSSVGCQICDPIARRLVVVAVGTELGLHDDGRHVVAAAVRERRLDELASEARRVPGVAREDVRERRSSTSFESPSEQTRKT